MAEMLRAPNRRTIRVLQRHLWTKRLRDLEGSKPVVRDLGVMPLAAQIRCCGGGHNTCSHPGDLMHYSFDG
jgi:hypothetical protein